MNNEINKPLIFSKPADRTKNADLKAIWSEELTQSIDFKAYDVSAYDGDQIKTRIVADEYPVFRIAPDAK